MKNRLANAALNTWLEMVEESRRMRAMQKRAMAMWQNRCISSAMNKWKDEYVSQKRNKQLLLKAALKMRNRSMNMAFESWIDVVDMRKRARHFFQMMLTRYERREYLKGFNTWKCFVLEAQMTEAHSKFAQTAAKKILLRMKLKSKAMAFSTWAENVESIKSQRLALKRAHARWNKYVSLFCY